VVESSGLLNRSSYFGKFKETNPNFLPAKDLHRISSSSGLTGFHPF
jgi:hypothetical protein